MIIPFNFELLHQLEKFYMKLVSYIKDGHEQLAAYIDGQLLIWKCCIPTYRIL